MSKPPEGLQLDLLTAIMRLRQLEDELDRNPAVDDDGLWWLLQERVLTCDLPRLEQYVTAETWEWADEVGI